MEHQLLDHSSSMDVTASVTPSLLHRAATNRAAICATKTPVHNLNHYTRRCVMRLMSYLLALAFLTSCRESASLDAVRGYDLVRLTRVLTPGTPETMVTQTFGVPILSEHLNSSQRLLTFDSLVSSTKVTTNQIIGFQVVLQSNVVMKWTPVHTSYDR
jgi:hypothetical protein